MHQSFDNNPPRQGILVSTALIHQHQMIGLNSKDGNEKAGFAFSSWTKSWFCFSGRDKFRWTLGLRHAS
jgi:hypothetical protein